MAGIEIQAGKTYWIRINSDQLKVRAVEKSQAVPGWWRCIAPMGTEIMVQESAFQKLTNDESGG